MTVKCGVEACPWRFPSGFCDKGFVFINNGGQCGWIFNDAGQVRPNWQTKGEIKYSTREEKKGAGAAECIHGPTPAGEKK